MLWTFYIVFSVKLFPVDDKFIMKHILEDQRMVKNIPYDDILKAFKNAQKNGRIF